MSDTAGLVTEQVQSQAQQVAQQAQQTASQVAGQAKQQTTSVLDSQMDRAADSLDGIAQALRQTSQQLQERQSGVSQLANQTAERVEQASRYLRSRDVNQVVHDAQEYARNNPGVFLSGALALGFLAARFLKSSPPGGGQVGSVQQDFPGRRYVGGASPGEYQSGGMPEGQFDYADVQHRYEDVRGVPPVQRRYAAGMMSTSQAPETMSDDMGTGLMADHPQSEEDAAQS